MIVCGRFNLSKMERIVRMSAEIQGKRSNETEAKEDVEYARLIADHAAKLRGALEAQLKAMVNAAKRTGQPGPGRGPFRSDARKIL